MRKNDDKNYSVKEFNLKGLNGISDQTLEMHFKLYEGYVKATNSLTRQIREFLIDGQVDQEEMPAYSELTRRLGFEYNGMVLHELYFENMTSQESKGPQSHPGVEKAIQDSFGSVDLWKTDFSSVGKMRGVGWVICYQNPDNGRLSNHWISLHESGNVAGFRPLLVMDVWEHAYLLDYQPSERGKYIESFLANVNWAVVAKRQ
ncbi:superoxide dismutase [uncultured Nitrospira sp.]|uniref:superoxide dismutase n=1 Tax=uncultured Nitrospira sp. TaxID=157176 RepID=UPI0031402684